MQVWFVEGKSGFRHEAEDAMRMFDETPDDHGRRVVQWFARAIQERALADPKLDSVYFLTPEQQAECPHMLRRPRIDERPAYFMPSGRLETEIRMIGLWAAHMRIEEPDRHRRVPELTFDEALAVATEWALEIAASAPKV